MKKLRKDIRSILNNQCLSHEEKQYLKQVFKNFVSKREIISRKSVDFEFEEEECIGTGKISAIS